MQEAVIAEMKLAPHTHADQLKESQIAQFRADKLGAELWDEWGEDAEHKYAVVRQRWNRLRNAMPESERPALDDFLDSLPPAALKEAFRQLAG